MNLWESIPNCQFWNSQWAAIVARVVKNYDFIDWECFLPTLFTRYLNMFEVSVSLKFVIKGSSLTCSVTAYSISLGMIVRTEVNSFAG